MQRPLDGHFVGTMNLNLPTLGLGIPIDMAITKEGYRRILKTTLVNNRGLSTFTMV